MLTDLNLNDMETCYNMLRRELMHGVNIEENRFECEPEIIAKIVRFDARIYELGISYYGRTYAQGKKIGWKDGMSVTYAINRYNTFPR